MMDQLHKRTLRDIVAGVRRRRFTTAEQRHRNAMSARFNELLDEGAAIGESAYHGALDAMHALRIAFAAVAAQYDAIITPTAPGAAPATLEETGSPAFCTLWTLLGVPAITIPVGLGEAGLPLGLQIVCPAFEDDRTLSIAAWCESHLPFPRVEGSPLHDARYP